MDISNFKIVLFDFDNMLCIHTNHGKWDEQQSRVNRATIVSGSLAVWDDCEISEDLKKFMELLKKNNIRMGLISTTESYPVAKTKQKFVEERYGIELENFCTGTQDGKLDMLNAIADAYGYDKQEVAIVDDYWYQLERASDAGFVAYFPLQIVNFMKIYKI